MDESVVPSAAAASCCVSPSLPCLKGIKDGDSRAGKVDSALHAGPCSARSPARQPVGGASLADTACRQDERPSLAGGAGAVRPHHKGQGDNVQGVVGYEVERQRPRQARLLTYLLRQGGRAGGPVPGLARRCLGRKGTGMAAATQRR